MVISGRLIPHASYSELVARVRAAEEKHGDDDVDMLVAAAGLQVRLCPKCSTISVESVWPPYMSKEMSKDWNLPYNRECRFDP